jgi:Polyketide cyclase / dehydrase and lipid transport
MESGDIVSAGGLQGALRERRGPLFRNALDQIARSFPKNSRVDAVTTTLDLALPSERVWEALRFYEEIPSRPSAILRLVLPTPHRSEGPKVQPGALIHCTYEGGYLVKRITVADRPHLLRFEVLEQNLGIESCLSLGEGSYEIRDRGRGCTVLLTTAYRGHLRPRFLWRPLERALAHAVHRHILGGIGHRPGR